MICWGERSIIVTLFVFVVYLVYYLCCLLLCVFSPGVVAFGAFEEACFWFVCASGLLCPIVGDIVVAFLTSHFDLGIGLDTFEYFNFFCGFNCFF